MKARNASFSNNFLVLGNYLVLVVERPCWFPPKFFWNLPCPIIPRFPSKWFGCAIYSPNCPRCPL
jgi:hypothetical protein